MHRPDLSAVPLDPFWSAIGEFDSHEAFERLADALVLRPEVPPTVARRFDLVRAAVRHAAVEAVLADAAFSRALLTLELALSSRHQDLGAPLPKKKRRLADLIDWGATVPLFENGPEAIHAARHLRNDLVAHPQGDARAFYHVLQVVREVPFVINGLYDDPDLRRERLDAWTGLGSVLDRVTQDGAVLDARPLGLGRHIIYAAACPFSDNRDGPLRIHVLAWRIHRPKAGPVHIPSPLAFDAARWSATDDTVTLDLFSGGMAVTVAPLRKPENVRRFAAWRDASARSQANQQALRSFAAHHAARVRTAHRHGDSPAPASTVVEKGASVPILRPPNTQGAL